MSSNLARHGSEAGYQAELKTKSICTRCRAAHRVYNSQYTKYGKTLGLKYPRSQVIDHLASAPKPGVPKGTGRVAMGETHADPHDTPPEPSERFEAATGATTGPSLSDRIRSLWVPPDDAPANGYVPDTEIPDHLHSVDPDPDPIGGMQDQWQPADDEFVINEAGIKKIEDNLGFYLSVIGLTVEMIDPYCGPILSENFDNIVKRWSKVIAHYPSAAKLFLDSKGGILFGWISAIQATWPVLYAMYEHHLAKTIRVSKGGVIERKVNDPGPFRGFDATTPPMDEKFEYSVR
jgi:hypothetical protein